MPPSDYSERILRIIGAKGYQPRGIREIARAIGIGEDESGDFHAACKALMKTGRVDAVNVLLALPDRKRQRILGACRSAKETAWRDQMLETMLKQPLATTK